jgi:hypothetical protein
VGVFSGIALGISDFGFGISDLKPEKNPNYISISETNGIQVQASVSTQ